MPEQNEFMRMAIAQLWQVSLVIAAAMILVRMVGKNRPHLAYMIWFVVLLKCVTPPVFSSPSSVFSQFQTGFRPGGL